MGCDRLAQQLVSCRRWRPGRRPRPDAVRQAQAASLAVSVDLIDERRETACIGAFSGRPDKSSDAAQTVCLVRSIATWEVTTALTTVGHRPANSYKAASLASRLLAGTRPCLRIRRLGVRISSGARRSGVLFAIAESAPDDF
ncbi:MAG: hypothetical protein QOI43_2919 [Gaiellales bacterium]|nr:hypothetical protein [Gaiellales bacterium]